LDVGLARRIFCRALPTFGCLALLACQSGWSTASPSNSGHASSKPGYLGIIPIAALKRDPSAVFDQVSQLRRLPQLRKTPVLFQDDAEFLQSHRRAETKGEQQQDPTRKDRTEGRIILETFSTQPFGQNIKAGDEWDIFDSEVAGFYESEDEVIVMRRSKAEFRLPSRETVDQSAWILAHEAMHALQFQHFPHLKKTFDTLELRDQLLAAQAVIEGDAMVAMTLYVASHSWLPIRRALVEHELAGDATAREDYEKARGSKRDLDDAPKSMTEQVLFPYRDGFRLMSALYRAGGPELSDRVYAALPLSTEQVLHPEKYVAGERPLVIPIPDLPTNWQRLATGSLGELRLRAALLECTDPALANLAASGWGGDSFLIAGQARHRRLLWSTAWDTQEDAQQFESALQSLAQCWQERDRHLNKRRQFKAGYSIQRAENEVAIVYGQGNPETQEVLPALLGRTQPAEEPQRPLPISQLPALPNLPAKQLPYLRGESYVLERADLKVPAVWGLSIGIGDDAVAFRRTTDPLYLVVAISHWQFNRHSLRQLYKEFASRIGGEVTIRQQPDPIQEVQTRLGVGYEANWHGSWDQTSIGATVIVVPICNNQGSIVLAAAWDGADSRATAQQWLEQIERRGKGKPPICSLLELK
jgi:hypothetical protein